MELAKLFETLSVNSATSAHIDTMLCSVLSAVSSTPPTDLCTNLHILRRESLGADTNTKVSGAESKPGPVRLIKCEPVSPYSV